MNVDPWWLACGALLVALVARRLLIGAAARDLVAEKIRGGALVLDVRTPDEFSRGAYPGAVNIPLANIRSRLGEVPKGRPVVLYCASGVRSAAATRVLRRAGYADVLNAGGVRRLPW